MIATGTALGSQHAEEAANLAVKKVFYILGVDVEDAESVENFREDLRFGGKLRKMTDHGMIALVGFVALGLITALVTGATNLLKR